MRNVPYASNISLVFSFPSGSVSGLTFRHLQLSAENLLEHIIMIIHFLSPLPHSENYLVKWSSSGLVKDIDQLHNLRAVFTVSVSACGNVCLPVRVPARLPVVVCCLFSYVTRHVGACLRSLCLLSSLRKSLARSVCLPRQSPLANGSPRAEGSACTHWEHFC